MGTPFLFVTLILCVFVQVLGKNVKQDLIARIELEEYIETEKLNVNPRYRPTYHIAPPVGWINDPNGFSYYKGQYHLFYQFYPYASEWGPMHWGHVVSDDLVNWERLPTALLPEKEQCFSGSAIQDGDKLVLMYTGHINNPVQNNETQYLAFSDNGVDFYKYEGNPVLAITPNNSPDFRDPKVWRNGDHWYVVVGSKTSDERGRVLLYRSKDLIEWEFLTVLGESKGDLGFMWECPDFFELDGKHVLLMSPQGIAPQGDRYKNLFQTGYIKGHFDYKSFEFIPEGGFQELDYGHDYYAAQTTEVNGRRLIVGWFGMWETPMPEKEDKWAGMMTIIRELRLDSNNRITMTPVEEMLSLRDETATTDLETGWELEFGAAVELVIEGDLTKDIDILLEGRAGGGKAWLRWDVTSSNVIVERESGDIRQVEWKAEGLKSWRLFLDTSSLELFCGRGDVVFSSRVYPLGGWKLTNQSTQTLNVTSFTLKRSVEP